MNGRQQEPPKAVRLVFELARADNPRLYDELARFPQSGGVFAMRVDVPGLPEPRYAG